MSRLQLLPIGAEVIRDEGVRFRIWAPDWQEASVVIENPDFPQRNNKIRMAAEDGYFSCMVASARAGTRYRFCREEDNMYFIDPASRFQPEGLAGPSEVINPDLFAWTDNNWPGVTRLGQIIYEMHIGTFSQEGTWAAAEKELPELAALGIKLLEIMPVADFPGRFGWGYDAVSFFAPTRLYGRPDDFRRFVDKAHGLGIGVILDVVYNHLGPEGCVLKSFAKDYYDQYAPNEWGDPIRFDGRNAGPVREFFLANVWHWIEEYHLDGLRFDATQNIIDASQRHILSEMTEHARLAAGGRKILLIAENEPQNVKLLRPVDADGCGLDALWSDDFHHSAMVAMTGRREAYYSDHPGRPQELISAVKWGFLFQGQRYYWQGQRRGTPSLDITPERFIHYLQNHDQVANSLRGERCHFLTSPGRFRAMTALLLLAPQTPMLFQGQEFCATSPFLYFADLDQAVMTKTKEGRANFLKQFCSINLPETQAILDDPASEQTFRRCKLDFSERNTNQAAYELYRDLIRLRQNDAVLQKQPKNVDGAVLGTEAFLIRFFGGHDGDRLMLINLGGELHLNPAPEPLLAPPEEQEWKILWSSEHPRYGGNGMPHPETEDNWRLTGHSAIVLQSVRRRK